MSKPGLTVSLLHKKWKWNVHQWPPNTLRTVGPTQLQAPCSPGSQQPTANAPSPYRGFLYWEVVEEFPTPQAGKPLLLTPAEHLLDELFSHLLSMLSADFPSKNTHARKARSFTQSLESEWEQNLQQNKQLNKKHSKNKKTWSHNTFWSLLTAEPASSRRLD